MLNSVTPRLTRLITCNTIVGKNCRRISATRKQQFFFEADNKGGYPRKSDYVEKRENTWQSMKQGFKFMLEEFTLLKEETVERFRMDPHLQYNPGEVDVTFGFNGDPAILDKWVVTCDSDYGEGNSVATLKLSPQGRGIFSGTLDSRQFNDGRIKRTGYCNVKSVIIRKSFQREEYLPWGPYTHLRMRVRGDGRNYLIMLGVPGIFDVMWNDSYQYVLHTRGGPYWQDVRIPFSKFFLVSKGRVQDEQHPVPTHTVSYIGLTASDKISGYFKLEIGYIGVEYDPLLEEEFAYEMYRPPTKFHI